MQDSSSNTPSNPILPLALVCSVLVNLGQYAIANDAIRNLDSQLQKASDAVNICEGKFQGFVQGRR